MDKKDTSTKVYIQNKNSEKTNNQEFNYATKFFEEEFCCSQDIVEPMEDINECQTGFQQLNLNIDLKKIDEFILKHKTSKKIFFACVFGYMLSRFTNTNKSFFSIIKCQKRTLKTNKKAENIEKLFPILLDCEDMTISKFIKKSENKICKTFSYDFYPLEALNEKYSIKNNIIFNYDSKFIYRNLSNTTKNKADIFFDMTDTSISINSSNKFSQDTIKRMLETYIRILDEMLIKNKLSDIKYIQDSDIKIFNQINDTEFPIKYKDILEAFNNSLKNYPNNTLVKYKNKYYTYAQGSIWIDNLLTHLSKIPAKSSIGILVPRCEFYLLTALGILAHGSSYVPIDDTYPDSRIEFMLKDSKVNAVLVSNETKTRAEKLTNKLIINISNINVDNCNKKTAIPLPTNWNQNDTAIILYTSGTTGVPKATLLPRKAILNYSYWFARASHLSNKDSFAMYCSFGFDVHAEVIFSSVSVGAKVVIIPNEIRTKLIDLVNYLEKEKVTYVHFPTAFTKLLSTYRIPKSIKVLFTGGEFLGNCHLKANCCFYDSYGPTEATVSVTYIKVKDKIDPSSIGSLIFNTKAYILDKEQRPVPFGAIGELYLSGCQLAKGYLNRSEATKKSFFKNPFDGDTPDYEKMYKTGDIVRFLPDKSIGFIGRSDSQVKIRGNRVELSEVDSIIRSHNDIDDVCVISKLNKLNVNQLIAYIVLKKNSKLSKKNNFEIKSALSHYIGISKPNFMIPDYFFVLENIPLNQNGKVNKNKLPVASLEHMKREYRPPKTKDEQDICNAYQKIFGVENIGLDDDFIELGGDSISAVMLLSQLPKLNVTSVDILTQRTPSKILNANYFNFLDICQIDKSEKNKEHLLSQSQLNIFLDIIAKSQDSNYLIPILLDTQKQYSIKDIKNALIKLLDTYPVLKTKIAIKNNKAYLLPNGNPEIINKDQITKNNLIKFLSKPFDVESSLSRFVITKSDNKYVVYGTIHHIIFDGYSIDILQNAFNKILLSKSVNCDLSYCIASKFDQVIKNQKIYKDAEKFFEIMLSSYEQTYPLSTCATDKHEGALYFNLNVDYAKINDFIRINKLSKGAFFTGAFAYVLSRFTGSEKSYFCYLDNGRDIIKAQKGIGMFVKTLPLILDCSDQSINKYYKNTSEVIYKTTKFGFYPFSELVKKFGIEIGTLFQYVCTDGPKKDAFDSVKLNNTDKYGLTLSDKLEMISGISVAVIDDKKSIGLRVKFNNDFSSKFIKTFINSYERIINESLCKNNLSDIVYTSSQDISFCDKFNYANLPLQYTNIKKMFIDKCKEYKNNILIAYNNNKFTFREVYTIANHISSHLKNRNVQIEDRVAIFTSRSHWFGLALYGAVNNGSTYMPIDLSYPDSRILFMLQDAEIKAILVDNQTEKRCKQILNMSNNKNCDIKVLNIEDINYKENIVFDKSSTPDQKEAVIFYTSGTTGKPKGVMISDLAACSFSQWYYKDFCLRSNDIISLFASVAVDVNIKVFFATLYAGASVDIVPEEIRLDVHKFGNFLDNHHITHCPLPVAFTKLFIDQYKPKTIKLLSTGGESLGNIKANGSYKLYDVYGPTEATCNITFIEVKNKIHTSSVGYLVKNAAAYVLDKEKRRVPVGAIGELYVSGYQLSSGYIKRDKENSKAFFKNIFCNKSGYDKMYATGDYVRILKDGTIGYIGRRDGQFKIRGHRIELFEVEDIFKSIDGVDNVTVQAINIQSNFKELCAYVVINKNSKFSDMTNSELTQAFAELIKKDKPSYMIPSYVIKLSKIPTTMNMKVDTKKLPIPKISDKKTKYESPSTETEKILCDVFSKVLSVDKIGVNDNFVLLGGDSIKTIRLLSELTNYDISVDAHIVMSLGTPKLIAESIDGNSKKKVTYKAVTGNVPLMPIQKAFFENRNSNSFVQSFYCKFKQDLNFAVFEQALEEVIKHHDMLRACYKKNKKGTIQQIVRPYKKGLYTLDILGRTKKDFKSLEQQHKKQAKENIDIYKGNLIHVTIGMVEDKYYVLFTIHHLIIDGVSWFILIKNISKTYQGILQNGQYKFPERSISYKEYYYNILEKYDILNEESYEYWKQQCSNIMKQSITGSAITYNFTIDLFDKHNFYYATDEELLLCSLARAYMKVFRERLYVSMESHGRDSYFGNPHSTIGWFTAVYSLCVECNLKNDDESLRNAIAYVQNILRTIPLSGIFNGFLSYVYKTLEPCYSQITFNYLADQFNYDDKLYHSVNQNEQPSINNNKLSEEAQSENIVTGLNFDIEKSDNTYNIKLYSPVNTYLDKKIHSLIYAFKVESDLIKKHCVTAKENKTIACPLASNQIGVLYDELAVHKGNAYSCGTYYKLPDSYDVEQAEQIIDMVIKKHPIFKCKLENVNMQWFIVNKEDFQISFIKDSSRNINEIYSSLLTPFNLCEEMSKFWVIQCKNEIFIGFDIHHIIIDATSARILIEEFNDIIKGNFDDTPDYRFYFKENFLNRQKKNAKYYISYENIRKNFKDFDPKEYNWPCRGIVAQSCSGEIYNNLTPKRKEVELYAAKHGISPGILFVVTYVISLSIILKKNKIYFTFMENGRHSEDDEKSVGLYANVIPMFVSIDKKLTVKDFVKNFMNKYLNAIEYNQYPYGDFAVSNGINLSPFIEYNHDLNTPLQLRKFKVEDMILDSIASFCVTIVNNGDGYQSDLWHSSAYDHKFLLSFLKLYDKCLCNILECETINDIYELNHQVDNYTNKNISNREYGYFPYNINDHELPQNICEAIICDLFKIVLEKKYINPKVSFYEYGGTSLQLLTLITHIDTYADYFDINRINNYCNLYYESPRTISLYLGKKEFVSKVIEQEKSFLTGAIVNDDQFSFCLLYYYYNILSYTILDFSDKNWNSIETIKAKLNKYISMNPILKSEYKQNGLDIRLVVNDNYKIKVSNNFSFENFKLGNSLSQFVISNNNNVIHVYCIIESSIYMNNFISSISSLLDSSDFDEALLKTNNTQNDFSSFYYFSYDKDDVVDDIARFKHHYKPALINFTYQNSLNNRFSHDQANAVISFNKLIDKKNTMSLNAKKSILMAAFYNAYCNIMNINKQMFMYWETNNEKFTVNAKQGTIIYYMNLDFANKKEDIINVGKEIKLAKSFLPCTLPYSLFTFGYVTNTIFHFVDNTSITQSKQSRNLKESILGISGKINIYFSVVKNNDKYIINCKVNNKHKNNTAQKFLTDFKNEFEKLCSLYK